MTESPIQHASEPGCYIAPVQLDKNQLFAAICALKHDQYADVDNTDFCLAIGFAIADLYLGSLEPGESTSGMHTAFLRAICKPSHLLDQLREDTGWEPTEETVAALLAITAGQKAYEAIDALVFAFVYPSTQDDEERRAIALRTHDAIDAFMAGSGGVQ